MKYYGSKEELIGLLMDRQLSKEAGLDAHLAKPLDIDRLKDVLSGLMNR